MRSGFKMVPWKLGRLLPAELMLAALPAVSMEERWSSFQTPADAADETPRGHQAISRKTSRASINRERHSSHAVESDHQRRASGDDSVSSGDGALAAPLCLHCLSVHTFTVTARRL